MKKRIAIMILILITILTIGGITVMSVNPEEKTVMGKMLKYDKQEEIKNAKTITNLSEIKEKVNDYLDVNHKTDDNISSTLTKQSDLDTISSEQEELKIVEVRDNETSETFYRITGKGAMLEVMKDSLEIKTYINATPPNFKEGTVYEKKKIESVANELLLKNNLIANKEKYEIDYVKEKTDFFPTVWFKNVEDNKLLFITFDPESKEIANLGTKNILTSDANQIQIDEETAKNIARNALKEDSNIMSIEVKEVLPNTMFLDNRYYYSQVNSKRNAYVITFDNNAKIQIYVDATTGEVIGGDGMW